MENYDSKFYLGKSYHVDQGEISDNPVLYNPDDLTTHAVAVGMTGSGKTGLCIDLLEEAALQDIPALMIDPKGDMTNTLLHFPELLPEDFQPWINPDRARREGQTLQEAARGAAELWKTGLARWGIGKDRIQALEKSAQFAVYTPGSEAGLPINILASLKAPDLSWEEHREVLREKISGTVMGLLGLVGVEDVDPVRSREHILLSNLFEHAWSRGQDLDLGELILLIQNPPFDKLGMVDLETFMSGADRLELAMLLNNILAAPGFQSWITGQPLDIQGLLYTPEGRPRHTVLYLAHLSEAERMFFVTLLYSAVQTWMRAQKGTTTLRALVYFDEIYGYLPPVKNPPSKTLILRMLKQARAFGVGQVLVTQNPVDVDYKALSNAGTWFIGKLQTEQDKNRLLEGLEGAQPGLEKDVYDRLISTLDKRVFLLHNVHEEQPQVFHTRWAMNYLTGPLTRNQIPALNELAGAEGVLVDPELSAEQEPGSSDRRDRGPGDLPGSTTPPGVPGRVDEYFYPVEVSPEAAAEGKGLSLDNKVEPELLYRPSLAAQASVRFLKRSYQLDYEREVCAVVHEPDRKGRVDWASWESEPLDRGGLEARPDGSARFASLDPPLNESALLNDLESDFKDWIYHSLTVTIRGVEELELFAGPEISQGEFREKLAEAAEVRLTEESEKLEQSFADDLERIKDRLIKEERELEEDRTELSQRKMEEMGTHAENLLSLLAGRRRRVSSSLTKRRMTSKAKADVQESLDMIDQYQQEIIELNQEKEEALEKLRETWQQVLEQVEEIPVTPYKKDISIEIFGVVWYPYYVFPDGKRWTEVPAFQPRVAG